MKRKPFTINQKSRILTERYLSGSDLADDAPRADQVSSPGNDAVIELTTTAIQNTNEWLRAPKVYIVLGLVAILGYAMYRDSK